MIALKNKLTILLLCALVAAVASHGSQGGPHKPQGGPHENQGRVRRQAEDDQNDIDNPAHWPEIPNSEPCDTTTTPVLSCNSCNAMFVCKPSGFGFVKPCNNPYKPYCNNGHCSHIPAEGC